MAIDVQEFETMAKAYADAWTSHDAEKVASFYAKDGEIIINGGSPIRGRDAIARDCAQAFYAEFPNLVVDLDVARLAGHHALFLWTLEGNHAQTGKRVRIGGWEAWELTDDLKVRQSHGYFDAVEYQKQIEEGI